MRMRQIADFEDKFEEFCDINKQLEESSENIFEKFRNQIKENFANELNKRDERIKKLGSDKAVFYNHILEPKKLNVASQSEIEELEHYGWRQCLRFEGVPIEKIETMTKCCQK